MRNIFNFSPGPAMLPEEVLKTAQAEMLDWHGTGVSVMELPHRGELYLALTKQIEADLRSLMSIPDNYHVLFLPDGATAQFAMVPLNLFGKSKTADYVDTGVWSHKAIREAERYGSVHVAASIQYQDQLAYVPPLASWSLRDEAAYVHYTPNETIHGIQFHWVPETGHVPLVADMSSMILSQPIDVSQFGIIYASAQKNIGQAGLAVVIIRDDLVQEPLPGTPTLYRYQVHVENHSLFHTPPTYSWYILGLVLSWMKKKGGVSFFYETNQRKAKKLYDCLDQYPDFYLSHVHPSCRSVMNVVYDLPTLELRQRFLQETTDAGLVYLKGHRLKEGIRASIYNTMPEEGVAALVEFMHQFVKKHG